MENGDVKKEKAIKQSVETFVDDTLNFPKAEDMINQIYVEFDYYDISDELLAKKEFVKQVKKFELEIREYGEGYKKAKAPVQKFWVIVSI